MTLLPVLALVKTYAFTYKKPLRVCLSTLPDRMSERLRFYSPCNRGLLRAMDPQLASCQLSCAPVGQHGACVGSDVCTVLGHIFHCPRRRTHKYARRVNGVFRLLKGGR